MTRVVRDGTGHNAAIPGYEVAGKTGTAQKLDPATRRYSRAPGVLSFVGFVPADDPRLAMLVMLDEPKNEKWGSEAAAPIFARIGREVAALPGRAADGHRAGPDRAHRPAARRRRAPARATDARHRVAPRPRPRPTAARPALMPRPARPLAAPGAGDARAARRAPGGGGPRRV